jgi:hypothetical protein
MTELRQQTEETSKLSKDQFYELSGVLVAALADMVDRRVAAAVEKLRYELKGPRSIW